MLITVIMHIEQLAHKAIDRFQKFEWPCVICFLSFLFLSSLVNSFAAVIFSVHLQVTGQKRLEDISAVGLGSVCVYNNYFTLRNSAQFISFSSC